MAKPINCPVWYHTLGDERMAYAPLYFLLYCPLVSPLSFCFSWEAPFVRFPKRYSSLFRRALLWSFWRRRYLEYPLSFVLTITPAFFIFRGFLLPLQVKSLFSWCWFIWSFSSLVYNILCRHKSSCLILKKFFFFYGYALDSCGII